MKTLAIIPARSGSKGVPNKNIRSIAGKPLIQYTLEAALESNLLDKVIVSSDGENILDLVAHFGVELHKRPELLAGDSSPVTDTISEILKKQTGYDAVMILQPTSPIRTGEQIDESIKLLLNNPKANSIISVVKVDDVHPARMYWKSEDNKLDPILIEFEEKIRQEIPPAYFRNGSIYLVRTKAFNENHSVMVKPGLGYVMPSSQLLNIDGPRDILIAEVLIETWVQGNLK
jgi:CMP-N,N'-diacetyllegionaminic acid synthase